MQQALSAGAVWMNGNIIPISEASIPVTDWELTHSDITYDVAPVRDGAFFRLIDYIDRFFASMAALQLNPNMTKQQVQDALIDMVAASAMRESYVAMMCALCACHQARDCRQRCDRHHRREWHPHLPLCRLSRKQSFFLSAHNIRITARKTPQI